MDPFGRPNTPKRPSQKDMFGPAAHLDAARQEIGHPAGQPQAGEAGQQPPSGMAQEGPQQPSPDVNRGRAGGWVNLGEFYGLNRDQAAQMAERTIGGLEQRAKASRERLEAAKRDFELRTQRAGLNSVGTGTTLEEAQRVAGLKYGGPQTLADLDSGLGADVEKVGGELAAARSGGAGGLLGAEVGKDDPYYGTAERGLDAALMGQGGGNDRIATLVKEYGGLGSEYGTADVGARNRYEQSLADFRAKQQAYESALPGLRARDKARADAAERERIAREAWAARERDYRDRQRQRGEYLRDRVSLGDQVYRVDDDTYAAQHGLTQEEWIAAGRPQTADEWKAYYRTQKG